MEEKEGSPFKNQLLACQMQAAQMQASTDSEDEVRETEEEKAQDGQGERDGNTISGKRTFSGGNAKKTLKVRVPPVAAVLD